MSLQRRTVLGDWLITGGLAAGTLAQPTAAAGNAELGTQDVAEITHYEIIAPLDNLGNPEDLLQIYPIIDGTSIQQYINLSGRDDSAMMPAVTNIFTRIRPDGSKWRHVFYEFGAGLLDALREPVPALANTTIKVRRRHTFIAQAGATAVTGNFRVRAWGYKYDDEMLSRLPQHSMSMDFTVQDRLRNRSFRVPGPASIPISIDTWDRLPGGVQQGETKINPFLRFARNVNATVPNTPYQLRFDLGNVQNQFQDLFFDFELSNSALIVRTIGARAGTNQLQTWLRNLGPGDPISQDLPDSRIPTTTALNPIHFGRRTPFGPPGDPSYVGLQEDILLDHVIWQDRAVVQVQDNGTPIPADSLTVAFGGTLIELPED